MEVKDADHLFAHKYPLRILIAEDTYINRRLIVLLLQGLGYRADYVENGQECLQAALETSYDMILTNVDMPEMDGFACASRIRQAGIHIPIIALTALPPQSIQDHCLHAGMNGHLSKPIAIEELQRTLRDTYLKKEISDGIQAPPPDRPKAPLTATKKNLRRTQGNLRPHA